MEKYLYPLSSITESDILKFVIDFREGRLQKYMKSEEIPVDSNEEVKTIVGKNFNEIIENNDLFLMFTVEWCTECIQLETILKDLAKDIKSRGGQMIFGKIDISKNELEGVEVEGYPSFWYFKKGKKRGIEYKRTLQVTL